MAPSSLLQTGIALFWKKAIYFHERGSDKPVSRPTGVHGGYCLESVDAQGFPGLYLQIFGESLP
jgi:hypothetical protein